MKTWLSVLLSFVLLAILGMWLIAPRIVIPEVKRILSGYGFKNIQADGAMIGIGSASLDGLSFTQGNERFQFKDIAVSWDGLVPESINTIDVEYASFPIFPAQPQALFGFPLQDLSNIGDCKGAPRNQPCSTSQTPWPAIEIQHADVRAYILGRVYQIDGQDVKILKQGDEVRFSGALFSEEDLLSGTANVSGGFVDRNNYNFQISFEDMTTEINRGFISDANGLNGKLIVSPQDVEGNISIDRLNFTDGAIEDVRLDVTGSDWPTIRINFTADTLADSSRLEGEADIDIFDRTAAGQYLIFSDDLSRFVTGYTDLTDPNLSGQINATGTFDVSYPSGGTLDGQITIASQLTDVDFQNFSGLNGELKATYLINEATLKTQADFDVNSPTLKGRTNLNFQRDVKNGKVLITGAVDRLRLGNLSLSSKNVNADFATESERTVFRFGGATLRFYDSLSRIPTLVGKLSGNYDQPVVKFDFSGQDAQARFELDADGNYHVQNRGLDINYDLDPIKLLNAEDLASLLPQAAGLVEEFSGTLAAEGAAKYNGQSLTTAQSVKVDVASMVVNGIPLSGVAGVLDVKTNPNVIINDEEIFIGQIDVGGLPLTDNSIIFSYNSGKNAINIKRNRMKFAGGVLRTDPFTYNTATNSAKFVVTADRLGLGPIFQAVPVDGLDATGVISGHLPVTISQGRISVIGGHLEAVETGDIQYDPDELPKMFQQDNMYIDLVRDALKDYNYSILSMDINLGEEENQQVLLKARGSNPDFFDGRPVEVNLNLEGELKDLLRFNVGAINLPERIKKQMDELKR